MNNAAINFQTIAVDFDGTLCYSKWPDCGQPNQALITYLQEWRRNGNKLILWTCREGKFLDEAVNWCKSYGLGFDAINDNLEEEKQRWGNNPRKVAADIYIDDRAYTELARWNGIPPQIEKMNMGRIRKRN